MRGAFTLIELVVVLVILSLLSGLVAFSLSGTTDNYRMSQAVETFELFDARARRTARYNQTPIVASIDSSNRILRVQNTNSVKIASFNLPRQVEIDEVRYSAPSDQGKLLVNSRGVSNSYAVRLRRGKLNTWILVIGGSGQILKSVSENKVNAILSM